ncbi:hypothetical protein [Aureibacillus halotolerans]|uniref:WD40 repeat protein n=1 Tax=Aureibacillus halotolerans TaxID=1508390 RepID=A0A4V6PWK8_9BACI|nr:hypothetical protein [Aureibacillus halotolerans]TDQ43027.1 hypothetical protein EV213_101459 [Aureibacillus halotolerans]
MKKIFLAFAMLMMFVAGCSQEAAQEEESENTEQQEVPTEEEGEVTALETTVLYEHDFNEFGEYSLLSLAPSVDGSAITFTANEDIDSDSEHYEMFVNQKNEVIQGTDLSQEETDDKYCSSLSLSPDGKSLLYNCIELNIGFSIYDMESKKTVHQMEEGDTFISELYGISNDRTVYLKTSAVGDSEALSLYDSNTGEMTHYPLEELFPNEEYPSLDKIFPTTDGSKILLDTTIALYMFDVDEGTAEPIVNILPIREEQDNEDIFLYDSVLSPNGTYLYYEIRHNDQHPQYQTFHFHNLDSGEETVLSELDYRYIRNIDNQGNVLLRGSEGIFLYNIDSGDTRIVPELSISGEYYTLTGNGDYIFYSGNESHEDETHTQYLYKVALGDSSSFATTEFLGTLAGQEETPEKKTFSLYDHDLDEVQMLQDIWNERTSVEYPTQFPETVESMVKSSHWHGGSEQTVYAKNFRFADSEREDLSFSAKVQDDETKGCLVNDLTLIENVDGVDYYYHKGGNDYIEMVIDKNNVCYDFTTYEYSKEEMLAIGKSMKQTDSVPHGIHPEEFKYPTRLPIEKAFIDGGAVVSFDGENTIDFHIDYTGEQESDIPIELEITPTEPSSFLNEDFGEIVEVANWQDGFFKLDNQSLHLYDGTTYYSIVPEPSTDLLGEYGEEEVKRMLIEIGESIQ